MAKNIFSEILEKQGQGETEGTDQNCPEGPEPSQGPVQQVAQDATHGGAKEVEMLMRALADKDNALKRVERSLEEQKGWAISAFAREVLTIVDNLERALGSSKEVSDIAQSPAFKTLHAGIEMVLSEGKKTLERFGITPMHALGQKVDPHAHDVVSVQEADGAETSKDGDKAFYVHKVLQEGYLLHQKILRPAMVCAGKGELEPS